MADSDPGGEQDRAIRGKEMYHPLTEGDDFGSWGRKHCDCMAFIHGVREWGLDGGKDTGIKDIKSLFGR
jgi:hypothetical protein